MLIVDEFTGRVLHGRRYNEGMHQAIEAKEGVEIKAENQTLATITLQNYFRLYEKLSGMTGTAQTEAAELHQTYGLGVVPIPPNRPVQRADEADLIYKTEDAKFAAVVQDLAERHEKGQPVLVGTASVEKSELLSKLLLRAGVPHEVLNAKNHAREAAIIAQAGRSGAVTVATNMAGRGTDIILGGNVDYSADFELRAKGLTPTETPEEYEAAWPDAVEEAKKKTKAEAEKVRDAGGLYVLGTERHESRRIDNQLRGRAGRQGDPGESRFYLSLGDDLMRRVGGGTVEMLMTRLRMPDDVPIEHSFVSKAIKSAQTQVEQQNFEIRKNVLKYDEVMNKQRTVIYDERRRVLDGEDLHLQVQNMITDVVTAYVDGATAQGYAEDWDTDTLWTALRTLYPISVTPDSIATSHGDLTRASLKEAVLADARKQWAAPRGDAHPADHPGAGAPGRAVGAGPQVARAPLRDGLPQGGHRPARDGPAGSVGRVPAGGLRHVRGHAGLAQGGVRRLPLQPAGPGGAGRRVRRRSRSTGRPRCSGAHRCIGGGNGDLGRGHRVDQRWRQRRFRASSGAGARGTRPAPGAAGRAAADAAGGRGRERRGGQHQDRQPGRPRRQGSGWTGEGDPVDLQRPARGRRHRDRAAETGRRRQAGHRDRDRLEGAVAQRAVPLRVGQEVQAVPRSAGRRLRFGPSKGGQGCRRWSGPPGSAPVRRDWDALRWTARWAG